ncbi:ATP-binding protein, partial [Nostoc sp. CHAB 5834]|nr:ATP-binding protein [Nostoc sp. CHAB 5834]
MEAVLDEFTMDKNLLVHVIKSQAGTLTKALVEAIMNSIDAGATKVDVTLDRETFSVTDNGRGFQSEKEVREWFGRFGTPHQKDDAKYGFYRMGRGQCMSYGICKWSSNIFQMSVDIEKHGMKYALAELQEPVPGCILSAELYRPLHSYTLEEVIAELREAVSWVSVPVFLNDALISTVPQDKKDWTSEDEYAYYFIQPESQELVVYNQGVFVERMSSWKTGFGGIVVSKRRLAVNFARNAVMANDCPVWKKISANMESVVLGNLRGLKKLSDSERNYLAKRMSTLQERGFNPLDVKVLTDATGKHLSPRELGRFKRFVCIPEDKSLAEAVHGTDGTFVLTSTTMNRFGVYDIYSFLDKMRSIPGALPEYYEVIEPTQVASLGLAGTTVMKV